MTTQSVSAGVYSVPRKCPRCEYMTLDRKAFWAHWVKAHEQRVASAQRLSEEAS